MGKGSAFEREVSKILSVWWTSNDRDDIFWKTSGSGGRATSRRKTGKDTAFSTADITFSDPLGEPLIKIWNIEAKSGYGDSPRKRKDGTLRKTNWCVLDLLDGTRTKNPELFMQMWEQCSRDARASARQPILIFRRPGKQICVAVEGLYKGLLEDWFGKAPRTQLCIETDTYEEIAVFRLGEFLEWLRNLRHMMGIPAYKSPIRKPLPIRKASNDKKHPTKKHPIS